MRHSFGLTIAVEVLVGGFRPAKCFFAWPMMLTTPICKFEHEPHTLLLCRNRPSARGLMHTHQHQHDQHPSCRRRQLYTNNGCGHRGTSSFSNHKYSGVVSASEYHRYRTTTGMVELPSLDNMPTQVVGEGSRRTKAPPSQRSRKGKYPVVELWKQEFKRDNSEQCIIFDENGSRITKSPRGIKDRSAQGSTGGYATTTIQGESGLMGTLIDVGNGDEREGKQHRHQKPVTALGYLTEAFGLAEEQTDRMLDFFPALAGLHPDKLDVPAKLRFLRHTMQADESAVVVSYPHFFGHPLERHIALRHAFLEASGRPSGTRLVDDNCRGLRRMLELPVNRFVAEMAPGRDVSDYRRFEQGFLRGPFDAARRGDAQTLRLLRSHGWDCFEEDRRGRNALFWAAGGGHIKACEALTEPPGGLRADTNASDLSTPLHWAATGVEAKRFGTGGHVDACRWLLSRDANPSATTEDGNSVVMWAAWAGGLETTRWAVEEAGADLGLENDNGCSVAHWAASGGDEAVCRYLHSKGVDFAHKNKGGNDPLNHAVAYGRRDIAAWLLGLANQEGAPNRVEQGGIGGVREDGRGEKGLARRRRDDSVLLDLARLTADKKMEAFLLSGDVS